MPEPPIAAAELATLALRHQAAPVTGLCRGCGRPWPCAAITLVRSYEALRAAVAELDPPMGRYSGECAYCDAFLSPGDPRRPQEPHAPACALAALRALLPPAGAPTAEEDHVELAPLPDYLTAPDNLQCNRCGRKAYADAPAPKLCRMPQPDGRICPGTLRPIEPAPPAR